jgi:hypothetical protein
MSLWWTSILPLEPLRSQLLPFNMSSFLGCAWSYCDYFLVFQQSRLWRSFESWAEELGQSSEGYRKLTLILNAELLSSAILTRKPNTGCVPHPECLGVEMLQILDFGIFTYAEWDMLEPGPTSEHKIHLYFKYILYTYLWVILYFLIILCIVLKQSLTCRIFDLCLYVSTQEVFDFVEFWFSYFWIRDFVSSWYILRTYMNF